MREPFERPLRVALVQRRAVRGDSYANLQLGLECCRAAGQKKADLVVFPEIWSSGYEVPFGRPLLEHGAYMRSFQEEARRLGLGIVATCLSKGKKLPQDTAVVISPTGEILMRYAKVHTCDFSAERALEPGEGFAVCDFPFEGGRVRLGVMTGFDREYPESARELMLKGAELIVVPNAGAMDPLRLGQLRTRAFENMVGVAMANYPGLGWGCSCAFSPIVYSETGHYIDNTLAMAGERAEGLVLADFDLEAIRAWRARRVWGGAYRKTYAYPSLLEARPPKPLVRRDNRTQCP